MWSNDSLEQQLARNTHNVRPSTRESYELQGKVVAVDVVVAAARDGGAAAGVS